MPDKYEKQKEIFKKYNNILRWSTAKKLGIPEHILKNMLREGVLVKETLGLYRLANSEPIGNPDLVQIALKLNKGVIFLISALYFHKLTTQIPHKIYIALPRDVHKPTYDSPPIKVFYLSQMAYAAGIENHKIGGISIKVYSKEKTIADCFKYRKLIGKDIALEALKDYINSPSPDISEIIKYAKVNRVEKIILPYIEALYE